MNYANLVQNKRRKMLFLVLLLALYPFVNVSAINLTYIIKRDKGVTQPSCIAEDLERYSAIGWIYPIPNSKEELPNITTRYTPKYENEFNCQFTKNSLCSARWSIRNWKTDYSSPRTRDVIMDSRWEELPLILISNETKEFKHDEIEVKGQASFSVRAQGSVELFLCSGWNPYSYPCHYVSFNDTEVYYKQYPVVPKDIKLNSTDKEAEHFKGIKNVLTHEEWRTFSIDWSDKTDIVLTDVNSKTTLIKHVLKESEIFTPLYMFLRSQNPSLWKIHQNYFFFTNSTQISRLGPQLTLNNKDLCISMFIKTCDNCETVFFYQSIPAQKKILKRAAPTNNEWIEIKIKEENTQYEKINLFVETKLINTSSNSTGYWAIDNVRICNENEVKISYLTLRNGTKVKEEDIACQLVANPSWRPKQLIYDSIQDFPQISPVSNTDSITLTWDAEDDNNEINYFVTYKANDVCLMEPHNLKRLKSNGFLWTKVNEITIPDLVPYTLYNITVETVLHQNVRVKRINTLETVEPTFEERPRNIQIRAMDTKVNVTWEKVDCKHLYGRLVYNLIVTKPELNFTKTISLQTDNSYLITGLQPYTNYSLEIITGRNGKSIYSRKNIFSVTYNFSTSAGIAPPVEDLEIYAMDANSASLRYSLPKDPKGVIREVQIMKCNALSFEKCKTYITPLRPCSLWNNKYCSDISNLTPHMGWKFQVSLKNKDTNYFGKGSLVKGFTSEKVPGKPGNITYRILDCPDLRDYCNLMVTWLHPSNQNGTITEFEIMLNSTEKEGGSEEDTSIHEIYKVENKTYYPFYTYQINYLPYSSHYNLYIQSLNKVFRSEPAQTHVKIDNVGDHIDQHPKLIGKSDSTLIYKLPRLDRRLDHYNLTVVVQDFNTSVKIDDVELLNNRKAVDHLCHRFGRAWIADVVKVTTNDTKNIVIGDAEKHSLSPMTKYCLTFIVSNKYKDSEHDVVYHEKVRTGEAPPVPKEAASSYNHLYLLLILLLLIPIGFLVYRYMRKRRMIPSANDNPENVYETLPFDECEITNNGVSNENYDRLIHK